VEGAEHPVEQGEVDREILVDRFRLEAVMPVMEARRGDEMAEPVEIAPHIGVEERGIDVDDADIDLQRHRRKPNVIIGIAVSPRSSAISTKCIREPASQSIALGAVMDGVEAPQERDAVEGAVEPVLGESRSGS
jgi:hypothetical protein